MCFSITDTVSIAGLGDNYTSFTRAGMNMFSSAVSARSNYWQCRKPYKKPPNQKNIETISLLNGPQAGDDGVCGNENVFSERCFTPCLQDWRPKRKDRLCWRTMLAGIRWLSACMMSGIYPSLFRFCSLCGIIEAIIRYRVHLRH